MNKPTFFETQVNNRKKFGFTEINSNAFEVGKESYFDYWPLASYGPWQQPMELQLSLLQIDKKPTKFKF